MTARYPSPAPGAAPPSTASELVFGAARLLLVLQGFCSLAFWFISAGNRPIALALFGDTVVARQLSGLDTLAQLLGCIGLAAATLLLIILSAYMLGRLALMAGYVGYLYVAFVQGGPEGLHPASIETAIVGGLICVLLIAATVL